jgi:hypothetical protein
MWDLTGHIQTITVILHSSEREPSTDSRVWGDLYLFNINRDLDLRDVGFDVAL